MVLDVYKNIWMQGQVVVKPLKQAINHVCEPYESWQIATVSVVGTLGTVWIWNFVWREPGPVLRLRKTFFTVLRQIPSVRNYVEKEMKKLRDDLYKNLHKGQEMIPFYKELPPAGWDESKVLSEANKYMDLGHVKWDNGRVSGTVYIGNDPKLKKLMIDVYGIATWTNPLHADVFPGVMRMEAEIVRMICTLYHGDEKTCGTVTTGGTESIFLACKAYRDYAREVRGILNPEMVVPVTAHAAFDKAAALLKIKIKHIPIDPVTMRVNVKAMRRAITRNTCMLVGSAPQYPHGIIDPVEEITKLGEKYEIPVHVDCCLGGFILPFMEKAGFQLGQFDFRLPGVTSISADTHKYGYAPKGSSVIMYREAKFIHQQYSVCLDWPGGIYCTPNIAGSRAGGIIAACWAALLYNGIDGYVEATKKIVSTTRYIASRLKNVHGLKILGEPLVSVIAFGSDHFNVYKLNDALNNLGWNLNLIQHPDGFHLCVTQMHTQDGVADQFINDITNCTAEIMKEPGAPATGHAALYGMAQSIPDRSLVEDLTKAYLDACYSTGKSN